MSSKLMLYGILKCLILDYRCLSTLAHFEDKTILLSYLASQHVADGRWPPPSL